MFDIALIMHPIIIPVKQFYGLDIADYFPKKHSPPNFAIWSPVNNRKQHLHRMFLTNFKCLRLAVYDPPKAKQQGH